MSSMMRNPTLSSGFLVVAALCLVLSLHAEAGDLSRDELIRSSGYAEIKIIEAHTPDLDPLPLQRDSDVFVRLYLNDTKELICETNVVQDSNNPQFNKECRTPKPVSAGTILRFEVFDSDRPSPDPDWIGVTKLKIADLVLADKLDKKENFPIEGRSFPKHFLRLKVDFKPEKKN